MLGDFPHPGADSDETIRVNRTASIASVIPGGRMKLGKLGRGKFWHKGLAAVLVYWGLMLFEVFTFSSAGKILGIGVFITAALVLFDR
jgi:hypothetical protein